ncbi:response regulator transcription factor [Pleionea sp. CnH1-48]|uniref:response regulator transcription factor n=1 Tax=Pleionea sp. CnH1-48 TaxID=2954494 RepID=UPI002097D4CB|nr:response regulator transcription factor [Pleionea sp. CnH1-48]MCO7226890.1 response regulator transcription factor [Pleionea sp. CnH1-48]
MADSVLIVEDDCDIAELIKVNLEDMALQAYHCEDGESALEKALNENFAIIILDVMLPGLSGLDVCRKIREQKPEQAILMLTSRSSEADRVVGLELGADDYMTKPFSIRELQARVRTQLRRVHLLNDARVKEPSEQNRICFGRLMIDDISRTVSWNDRFLELTSTEFDLLFYFAAHPNQVFSRSQLLDKVWGYQHNGYEHTVNSHINRLRSKLETDAANPLIVQTVWGVGYKFDPKECE